MVIVLPITHDTAALALKSLTWARTLLGPFQATLLVVPSVNEGIDVDTLSDLGELFEDFEVLASHQKGLDRVFEDIYHHFKRNPSYDPWFWWEPSFTLLRSDFTVWPYICQTLVTTTRASWLGNKEVFVEATETTYPTLDLVHRTVDFRIPILIGCHDGSVIDRLSEERNSTAVNVPNHFENVEYYEPTIETPPGSVDILYVTYKKDFPWLNYSLKSLAKFATGFRFWHVAVPQEDVESLQAMAQARNYARRLHIIGYVDAPPGKGFVMHAAKICQADLLTAIPEGENTVKNADFILHMDADCIMKEPNDAGHYFVGGKPVYVWRPYSSLCNIPSGLKRVEQACYQWKAVSEKTIGMELNAYTMCRHPTVFPRSVYRPFREQVEKHHGIPFEEYFIAQKNDFPMGVAEFPSLGGFCFERLHDQFHWVNCIEHAPRDLMKDFWSHGGLDQYIGEHWFNGHNMGGLGKKETTARMVIEGYLK